MLSVSDLSCVRGDQTLFSGVSFDLNAGQWLHLEGSNGSGKTSLLRIVTGFTPPAHGQVRWKGLPLAEAPEAFHADLLYLGHALALKDELSALTIGGYRQLQPMTLDEFLVLDRALSAAEIAEYVRAAGALAEMSRGWGQSGK